MTSIKKTKENNNAETIFICVKNNKLLTWF